MFVAKSKFPLNDLPEMQVHRFRDENESCDFGQLTFPIMKANCEPELPEMLKLSLKVTSTFLNPDNTFRCTVPEIRNDFAVDLSRFETFFEALEHSPLGKKRSCCAMSQAVPADLSWNQARVFAIFESV